VHSTTNKNDNTTYDAVFKLVAQLLLGAGLHRLVQDDSKAKRLDAVLVRERLTGHAKKFFSHDEYGGQHTNEW